MNRFCRARKQDDRFGEEAVHRVLDASKQQLTNRATSDDVRPTNGRHRHENNESEKFTDTSRNGADGMLAMEVCY